VTRLVVAAVWPHMHTCTSHLESSSFVRIVLQCSTSYCTGDYRTAVRAHITLRSIHLSHEKVTIMAQCAQFMGCVQQRANDFFMTQMNTCCTAVRVRVRLYDHGWLHCRDPYS
jgi:hypothetical protein